MKIVIIVALLVVTGFVAFAVFGVNNFAEQDHQATQQQAFKSLFKDNIDEGKQDFFFIGTHCMTVEADLELPKYFTEHYNELAAASIIFSVENSIQSPDDPSYLAFIRKLSTDFRAKTAAVNEQIANETNVMKEAMEKIIQYVNETEIGLYKCIGDRLIDEQSGAIQNIS